MRFASRCSASSCHLNILNSCQTSDWRSQDEKVWRGRLIKRIKRARRAVHLFHCIDLAQFWAPTCHSGCLFGNPHETHELLYMIMQKLFTKCELFCKGFFTLNGKTCYFPCLSRPQRQPVRTNKHRNGAQSSPALNIIPQEMRSCKNKVHHYSPYEVAFCCATYMSLVIWAVLSIDVQIARQTSSGWAINCTCR